MKKRNIFLLAFAIFLTLLVLILLTVDFAKNGRDSIAIVVFGWAMIATPFLVVAIEFFTQLFYLIGDNKTKIKTRLNIISLIIFGLIAVATIFVQIIPIIVLGISWIILRVLYFIR